MKAESACYTLGFTNGGTFGNAWKAPMAQAIWSEPEIPILGEVHCESNSANFTTCENSGWDDCDNHKFDVLLTCFEGKIYTYVVKNQAF